MMPGMSGDRGTAGGCARRTPRPSCRSSWPPRRRTATTSSRPWSWAPTTTSPSRSILPSPSPASKHSSRAQAGRRGTPRERGAVRAGRSRGQRRAVGLEPRRRNDVYLSARWKLHAGLRRRRESSSHPDEWLGRVASTTTSSASRDGIARRISMVERQQFETEHRILHQRRDATAGCSAGALAVRDRCRQACTEWRDRRPISPRARCPTL